MLYPLGVQKIKTITIALLVAFFHLTPIASFALDHCSRAGYKIPPITKFCGACYRNPSPRRIISMNLSSENTHSAAGNQDDKITILGFGSLLSETSARTTFPDLEGFRLGRVRNFRRLFQHPASIFFQRGIANLKTKEIASLSTEPCDGHPGFVCSVFEVPNNDVMSDGVPSQAFLEREEEFNILSGVKYENLGLSRGIGHGILCTTSTDQEYISRWGEARFEENYKEFGVDTIWGWKEDSGIRPCAVYLRHCYLAAKAMGSECLDSFLDETYLVDRTSTVRQYLEDNPQVLDTLPPPELLGRYSG